MNENYHKWYSQYLGKEFEMLVFGTAGIPVIYFPPEKDRYYSAKDNGLINSVSEFIENGSVKLYCPDTYDYESWFNFKAPPELRVKEYLNFEQLLIHDVIGFTKYETEAEKVILAGSKFGGYHAMNFSLKHPDMVSGIISLSGFYDIKQFIYGYYDDDCYFNNPVDYLPGLNDQWYLDNLKKIKIFFGCSDEDPSLNENKHISYLLGTKEINNTLITEDIKPGWELWNLLFNRFISLIINQK